MTISITGILRSTRTQRVILVLEELQLSYELTPVDLLKGEHQVYRIRLVGRCVRGLNCFLTLLMLKHIVPLIHS